MNHHQNRRALALLTAPLALVMALGVAAAPAQASSTKKKDPAGDHLGGTSGTLDLAGIAMKTKGSKKIQITFRLHDAVTADDLAFPGGMAVEFYKDKKTIRAVRIHSRDGVVQSDVCTYDLRKDLPTPTSCGTVPFTQVDDKTFRAVVKRKQVKKRAKVLTWQASVFDFASAPGGLDVLGRGASKPYRWRL